MIFNDSLVEVVIEMDKAGLSGLNRRLRYVLVELWLVLLEGQDVVSASTNDRPRYVLLTSHGVYGHCAF